jgi:hypothetical protein
MGFFSWDCNVCGHPMLSPDATNRTNRWMADVVVIEPNGSILMGEYDGYGRVNDRDVDGEPCCYHHACWEVAGKPTKYIPSESAHDQGWFFDDPKHDMPDPRKSRGMRGFGAVARKIKKQLPDEAEFYAYLYKKNKGIFYRGEGADGHGVGMGALGAGLYVTWEKAMAKAFADRQNSHVFKYKLKPGLKLLDAQSRTMAWLKAEMGFHPWEYSDDPMYALMLTDKVRSLGYDGVISDKLADGLVIFNAKNAKKVK